MEWLQYILVGVLVLAAVVFLFRKQLFPESKDSGSCGNGDCGCN
ncbi:MAG: FeoB-associated Cys-rich membrane protein [Nonlabens sp.]